MNTFAIIPPTWLNKPFEEWFENINLKVKQAKYENNNCNCRYGKRNRSL